MNHPGASWFIMNCAVEARLRGIVRSQTGEEAMISAVALLAKAQPSEDTAKTVEVAKLLFSHDIGRDQLLDVIGVN